MTSTTTVIDLSDPQVLRDLIEDNTHFIAEFAADSDSEVDSESDMDREEMEDEDDEDDEDDDAPMDVRRAQWRVGFTEPPFTPFTGTQGLLIDLDDPEEATPLDYFRLLFTNDMVHLVTETNRYAKESLDGKELAPRSRFRKWVDVTFGEMMAFLGLVITMGLVPLTDLDNFWSTDIVMKHPFIPAVMKRDRFALILSFLHVCENQNQPPRDSPNYDPLYKIRPFISSLRENFMRVMSPGVNIAIDEAMIAWRGALSFRVYNPDKPDKFGIKVFQLCDSATGFCHNFEFYTGRTDASEHGATFDVVDRLITPYTGCGRRLYTDNYYTSPDLYSHLKELGVLACGTMRINRKYGPPKNMIPKLTKRDTGTQVLTNGSLNLLRFFDKREVNVLTTAHDDSVVRTGKRNSVTKEPIRKLKAIHQYNRFMGGVDRCDQMVKNHAFRRRTLKWWKKGFFHMFMLSVLNSYIIQKVVTGSKLCHQIFRRRLVAQLVEWTPIPPCLSATRINVGDSALFRLTARHFIKSIRQKPGQQNKYPQRDCVVCTEPRKRMSSRYECRECNVGLHVACFELYHTVKDYKRGFKRLRTDS